MGNTSSKCQVESFFPPALKWPTVISQQQQQAPTSQFASTRVKEQQKQDEALLQVLNFDQIEIEFRSRVSCVQFSFLVKHREMLVPVCLDILCAAICT